MKIHVSQLTPEQLPHALMLAMKRKTLPTANWELAGKLVERERIQLNCIGIDLKWIASYMRPFTDAYNVAIQSDTPVDAILKCYIAKKLGYEIELE